MQTVSIASSGILTINSKGDFFRIMDASYAVSVKFYLAGREVADSPLVKTGYAETFLETGFDRVVITNGATAQVIQFVIRAGSRIEYDTPPVGNVNVTNSAGVYTQAAKTITSAGMTVSAANAARRAGELFNIDASGTIYLTLDGSAATAANGIPIGPNQSFPLPAFAATGAINAKSTTATCAAVWIEG